MRGEQPVVCIDEACIAGIQPRHVVVVVESGRFVGVGIRAAGQMQRRRHPFKTGYLLAPEDLLHRLFHREVQHAGFAVAGQGVGGDLGSVVVEGLAEHEKPGCLRGCGW